jgi:acyl-coenzyme A thioesterase PaaI-like protein
VTDDSQPNPGPLGLTERADIKGRATTYGGDDYAEMIDALRTFQDRVAGARPPIETIRALSAQLREWNDELEQFQVRERDQVFGKRTDLPGRGQTMSAGVEILEVDDNAVRGRVRFGRFFLGGNWAVHGGAIPTTFDEVLGRLANTGGRHPARTAYLNVNFRSITPVERDLVITGRFVKEEGRKRLLTAELYDGDRLCADAEGLFIELKPGQP